MVLVFILIVIIVVIVMMVMFALLALAVFTVLVMMVGVLQFVLFSLEKCSRHVSRSERLFDSLEDLNSGELIPGSGNDL